MKFTTKKLTILGLLIALEVVFARFLSISAWNIRIGFSFLPIVLAGMLYGPIEGGIVGAISDLIGALLFPSGPFFPGFTLSACLTGIVFGLFLKKDQSIWRIILAVVVNQIFMSLLLNSFWISTLYGSPFVPVLTARLVQSAIVAPVQVIVILILKRILPSLKKML